MKIKPATRLAHSNYAISKYIAEIDRARLLLGDRAIVDMSMGNPDLVPAKSVQRALQQKVPDIWSHRYNNPKGDGYLFHTVAGWFEKRFNVNINPRSDVMVTSGSSDAINHIFTAFANHGDKILVPNPGYSLYDDLIASHDLEKIEYDLLEKNNYQPDFSKIPTDARIMIINYPHNPTGVFATHNTLKTAVNFARKNNMLIVFDMDNSEITQSGRKPHGIMEIDGAKEVAFQVHTFSKAQSMPGFRVAFVVGNKENINNLLRAKYLSGGSVYVPIQYAAAAALIDADGFIDKANKIYRSRKNITVNALRALGSDVAVSAGTYYLWVRVPCGFTSDEFFKYVLYKSGVAFTPGTVFGTNGEGFVRIVMSVKDSVIVDSFDKIEKSGIRFDVSKYELSARVQNQIKKIANGQWTIVSKQDRDFADYMKYLARLRKKLQKRYADKSQMSAFIPKENLDLPWNLLKDGGYIYLQDQKDGDYVFAKVYDITPYSEKREYRKIIDGIRQDWLPFTDSEILPVYRNGLVYPDANYFVLVYDNKIQAIANLELQSDGYLWVRGLNSAPWNQGENKKFEHCGLSVMARIVSFALERGHKRIKLAADDKVSGFYKTIGMTECGTRFFDKQQYNVFMFNEQAMKTFLGKFQKNLSF